MIILEDICKMLSKISKTIILTVYSIIVLALILHIADSESLIRIVTTILTSDFLWVGVVLIIFPLCAEATVALIILFVGLQSE